MACRLLDTKPLPESILTCGPTDKLQWNIFFHPADTWHDDNNNVSITSKRDRQVVYDVIIPSGHMNNVIMTTKSRRDVVLSS